ncbi:MAG TPA: SMI1/KNR4 family protein [Spirochaetota bacterium]|nr:SMI1/KNR4 family protein [Spirochaetota bacterium]
MQKHLTYQDEKSSKFWKIETCGKSFTVKFGKIGTSGQTQTKEFESEEKCLKEAEKLIKEKLKKGYIEENFNRKGTGMVGYFNGYDFKDFWDDDDYALEEYVEDNPSDDLIKSIEEELGYKLPSSYIALMKSHNGGIPAKTCHSIKSRTSWAENHIAISGIMGIGRKKAYSICGELGSQFMIDEWGYPQIGVVICDCPSAGHDVIMLDYRNCGKDGEPEVVHVDQEFDYKITFVAKNFETFIIGLEDESKYDED